LGTVIRPKQWKVPVVDSGDSISKVSLSNKITREFIVNIEALVHHIFLLPEYTEQKQIWINMLQGYRDAMEEYAEQKQIWVNMLQDYRDAMEILRQPQDYTDDDIKDFQGKIDSFFTVWRLQEQASKSLLIIFICWVAGIYLIL